MKRIYTLMAAVIAALLLMAMCGCNGTEPTPPEDTEVDLTRYPFYVAAENAEYAFDSAHPAVPYWKGNIIYNESVMLTGEDGNACGKLMYAPIKVLSVRDYKWDKEYVEGVDYTIKGNTITRLSGSEMPFLTKENLIGTNIDEYYRQVTSISNTETDYVIMGATIYTEGSLVYGHQVCVSYVYDVKELYKGVFAEYEENFTPKLKAKLSAGEDVKIAFIGDSVSEGCSSSGTFKRAPYMDNFATLFCKALDEAYEGKVTLANLSVGGTTSTWGASSVQIAAVVDEAPDALFIHFGINDAGNANGKGIYRDNISKLVLDVQAALPNCECVAMKAFTPHPVVYDAEVFEKYWSALDGLSEEIDNFYTFDMYSMSIEMLKTKNYFDVTGNGINHLNDFSARLVAMNLCSALIKYEK